MSTRHDVTEAAQPFGDLPVTPSAVAAVLLGQGIVLSDDRIASLAEGVRLLMQMRTVLWDTDWIRPRDGAVPR